MHTNIVNKHFSKSDKIQDFHMIVDDDPVVVDESIKFSFNNVNNEVVLVNNTSTLSTDTCIYINDLSNESEISNDGLSNIVSNTTATNITCTRGYNVVNCIESNINKNVTCNSEKYSKEIYVLSNYLDVVEIENRNFDIIYNFYYETCIKTKDYHCNNTLDSSKHLSSCQSNISDRTESLNSSLYSNPVNNHDIKLLYLNCCGFKSKLKYPEFENLIRSNDFVCFVETKTDMFDSIDLPGYVSKSKHRKNVARMRSGGILLGFRENLVNHVQILENECEFVLWVKIDGKVFNLKQPVIFGTI